MSAEILVLDDEHIAGTYCALLVAIWGKRTRPEKVARFMELSRTWSADKPRMAMIVVVEPHSELPDKEARKKLEELSEVLIPKTIALTYVFEGSGLRAVATRTLMTALMLVGPPSARQHKITRTVDEALDWLVPHLAGPEFGNEEERRDVVHELQRRFDDYRANPGARSAAS